MIFYKDINGRFIQGNKALANALRMSVTEFSGKTTEELFPKEQAKKMMEDDLEVISSGKPKTNIIESYNMPDKTICVLTDKIPYKDEKGKITGLIILSKDITEQKKSEKTLQQIYKKLKKTMDTTIQTLSKIIEVRGPYTSRSPAEGFPISHSYCQELNFSKTKL